MITRIQDRLWRATLDEIRGLRRDVQDLASVLRQNLARTGEEICAQSLGAAGIPSPTLTIGEVARLLRRSPKAVYAMLERVQVPGVVRLGRKILVRRDRLMRWLSKNQAPDVAR